MLSAGPFRIGRPPPAQLQAILDGQAGADVTYPEVGASLGDLPPGYHHARQSVVLGTGDDAFAAGAAALRRWAGHAAAGAELVPDGAPLVEGQDVLLVLGLGPLTSTAACRIVATVDTPHRFGFAYGTLPLHPVSGEESFLIDRRPDGAVLFSIAAFSRPSALVARLGTPVTRLVQKRTTSAYLEGVRACC